MFGRTYALLFLSLLLPMPAFADEDFGVGIVKVSSVYENDYLIKGFGVLVKSPATDEWFVYTVSHLSQGRKKVPAFARHNDIGFNKTTIEYFDTDSKTYREAKILTRIANNRRDVEILKIEPPQHAEPLLVISGFSRGGFGHVLSAPARKFFESARDRCFDYRGRDGFFLDCGAKQKQRPSLIDTRSAQTAAFSRLGLVVADYELLVLGPVRLGMSGLPYFIHEGKDFQFIGLASSSSRQFRSGWVIPEFFYAKNLLSIDDSPRTTVGEHYWQLNGNFTSRLGVFKFEHLLPKEFIEKMKRENKYKDLNLEMHYLEAGEESVALVPRLSTGNGSRADSGNGSRADSGNGSRADSGNGSRADSGNGSRADSGNGSRADSGEGSAAENLSSYGTLQYGRSEHEMRPLTGLFFRTPDKEFFLPPDYASLNVYAEFKYLELEGKGPPVLLRSAVKGKDEKGFAHFVWNRLGLLAIGSEELGSTAPDQDEFKVRFHAVPLPLLEGQDVSDLELRFARVRGEAVIYVLTAIFEGKNYTFKLRPEQLLSELTISAPPAQKEGPTLSLDAKNLFFDSPSSISMVKLDVNRDLIENYYKDVPPLKRGFFFSLGARQFFAFF